MTRNRRILFSVLSLGVALCALAPAARAQQNANRPPEATAREFFTQETQDSVTDGLKFLADHQNADGSFGSGEFRGNVAVTGLCGMAFLSAGHQPGRGEYGDLLDRAIDYILSRARPNGFIIDEKSQSYGPMYGHGFATLFLSEAYGTTPRDDVRDKLQQAVKLIVSTQNAEGGWRYHPEPKDADISVTVCQMMALRSARNCGIRVPKTTVDKCVEYVQKSQNPDGGFRYQLTTRGESVFARSAAAVVALYGAGQYDNPQVARGLAYVMRHLPQGDVFRFEHNYFYGHYYAVQAMWQVGGESWEKWYPAIRNELLRRQLGNGRWPDNVCDEFGTAMACLILQMPNNFLPISQR